MKNFCSPLLVFLAISILCLYSCEDDGTKPKPTPVWEKYDLVIVPETTGFPMGWAGISDDEKPVHSVSVDEFQFGKYEVTYALWVEVKSWAEENGYTFKYPGQQGDGSNTTDQHPVTMMTRMECMAWCNALSEKARLTPAYYRAGQPHIPANVYRNSTALDEMSDSDIEWSANGFRLPTEAEWEYAARYKDGADFTPGDQHSGSNIANMDGCAWHCGNAGGSTHPVGEKLANNLGIYDMSGNVWEYCWDGYDANYYETEETDNPHGPDPHYGYHVIRGGGWSNAYTCSCRTSDRDQTCQSYNTGNDLGFRICRVAGR